ncbi:unnamed protein product [Cuscuta epithymum]|uniref:Uncharacterized protein n=1 Tax=Cuscuta epithymum TaxID=186058 RepID=A0AAV0GL57_9ASTE|nr:unnamed protein product [Cuscuta epithymum]
MSLRSWLPFTQTYGSITMCQIYGFSFLSFLTEQIDSPFMELLPSLGIDKDEGKSTASHFSSFSQGKSILHSPFADPVFFPIKILPLALPFHLSCSPIHSISWMKIDFNAKGKYIVLPFD